MDINKIMSALPKYPLICEDVLKFVKAWCISANQTPDYVISFGNWYAIYPDGHQEYIGPTGRKKLLDLGADIDGREDFEY